MRKLPGLDQTTNQREQDLIRDRLLSFKVRNGSLAAFDSPIKKHRMITINERTQARKLQNQREKQAQLAKQNTRHAASMNQLKQHKAFWVHNQSSKEIALPSIN